MGSVTMQIVDRREVHSWRASTIHRALCGCWTVAILGSLPKDSWRRLSATSGRKEHQLIPGPHGVIRLSLLAVDEAAPRGVGGQTELRSHCLQRRAFHGLQ